MGKPRSADQTSRDAHRVHVGRPGPVGERRSVEHGRSRETGAISGENRNRPTGLAVAVEHGRLAAVAPAYLRDEASQRMEHVRERLARAGLREEDHEIHRMAFVHGDPDLGVPLETADAGTMSRARVDHDHGSRGFVDTVLEAGITHRRDAEQRVVGGSLEGPGIDNRLVFEAEQWRQSRGFVREHVASTFPQCVDEEYAALPEVHLVLGCVVGEARTRPLWCRAIRYRPGRNGSLRRGRLLCLLVPNAQRAGTRWFLSCRCFRREQGRADRHLDEPPRPLPRNSFAPTDPLWPGSIISNTMI